MKRLLAAACVLGLLLTACGVPAAGTEDDDTLHVLATTYPVYLFTTAVTDGVEGVEVSLLVNQPVSCLHDYTLTVTDMKAIEGADVIVRNGAGLEDFMDDALAASDAAVIDCSEGIALLPAMGHEVRIGNRIIHIVLFVVTLGLYSIPLLLIANHGMNKHIRNQWKYETDLMMKIIRNEGGIGVEGFGSNQPSNAFLRFLKNAL